MKILVLAGGLSPERDVSLCSGSLIANALMARGHEVGLVDLYMGVRETDGLFFTKASGKRFEYSVPEKEPDLAALAAERGSGRGLIGPNVLKACTMADLVFVALHGSIGENGQLQAALDIEGICYTGSGCTGSMLAMDKDLAKRMLFQSGVPTPEWELVDAEDGQEAVFAASKKIGLPCVIKPLGCGSSVGVSVVRRQDKLLDALASAQKHERYLIVERMIEGREFSAGVLDGAALPIIEIIPKTGFYDYANKYQPGYTTEICPAKIPKDITARIQASALAAHKALRLGFYSRVDFMLDRENRHFCLEANTLPGMTPTSLLPQEAQAAGISYEELCEKIAMSAILS